MQQLPAQLLSMHQVYQHYNQRPHESSMRLAELGHPLTRWFQLIQAMFDSLFYCSNASERFMAFSDDGQEQVRLRRPEIREPKEMAFKHNGQTHLMPAPKYSREHNQFIDAFAAAGFPKSKAHLGCSFFTLTIRTSRDDVQTQVLDAVRNSEFFQYSMDGGEITVSLRRKNGGGLPPLKCWRPLVAMLKKLFKESLLAYPAEPPVPQDTHLFNRPFRTGNVQTLTVTPHAVVAPLLSLSGNGTDRKRLANDVKQLVEQGYPVKSNLQAYLAALLSPTDLRQTFGQSIRHGGSVT